MSGMSYPTRELLTPTRDLLTPNRDLLTPWPIYHPYTTPTPLFRSHPIDTRATGAKSKNRAKVRSKSRSG